MPLSVRAAFRALELLDIPTLFGDYITGTCPNEGKEPGLSCTYGHDISSEGRPSLASDRLRPRPQCWEACWKPYLLSKLTGLPVEFLKAHEAQALLEFERAYGMLEERWQPFAFSGFLGRLFGFPVFDKMVDARKLIEQRFSEVKPEENPKGTVRVSMTMGPGVTVLPECDNCAPDDCDGGCDNCDYFKTHAKEITESQTIEEARGGSLEASKGREMSKTIEETLADEAAKPGEAGPMTLSDEAQEVVEKARAES